MKDKMPLRDCFKKLEESDVTIVNLDDCFHSVSLDSNGTDWVLLKKEHIEDLKSGKVLHLPENGGEYQMFIRLDT